MNKDLQDESRSPDRVTSRSLIQRMKEDLEGGEKRRLRLVIAIPALMILITLSAGIIGYEFILDIADSADSLLVKAKLERAANFVLLANFIACGVALIFGVGLARYIVRPIRIITQRARSIVRGSVSEKVPFTNPDEIGELSDSFNTLIDHLHNLFKERDRYILEGFTEGLISVGEDGEILAANTQAEKIMDLSAKDMIGMNLKNILINPDENVLFNEILKKCLRFKSSFVSDKIAFVNSKGRRFNLSVSINPLHDKQGKWRGCIISLRDLSVLAAFTEQIQHADRLAAIGSFATGITHELRNPLGSIKGVAQLLGEMKQGASNLPDATGEIFPMISKYAGMIIGEVDRLDRVIRTILDFAQPEPEERTPQDLNPLLSHATQRALHHPSMEERHTSFRIEKDFGEIPMCRVQKFRITQAFGNIILNALQSVDPDGVVRVESRTFSSRGDSTRVEIQIINDGPPIPSDLGEKIFEPFFTTRSFGTGLGLPISYQIIVFNEGTLDFRCENGQTAFILSFPALPFKENIVPESNIEPIDQKKPSPIAEL